MVKKWITRRDGVRQRYTIRGPVGDRDVVWAELLRLIGNPPSRVPKKGFLSVAGVPLVDHPKSFGATRELVYMSPKAFLELVQQSYGSVEARETPFWDSLRVNIGPSHVYRLMSGNRDFPVPWLEYRNGRIYGHEGRHRAMAAWALGHKQIPVYIIRKEDPKYDR